MSVDLDSLDPEVRLLAFWLQEKIYEEGIEGVHYMESARVWAKKNAADVTAREVSKELKRL